MQAAQLRCMIRIMKVAMNINVNVVRTQMKHYYGEKQLLCFRMRTMYDFGQ